MKSTSLTERHSELGAKMTDFAGFNMPVQYSSIKEEHRQVRNGVGVFDVSHMGEFIVKGKGALDLVQRISSNDASKLDIGQAQYACLPNDKGGIVDDFLVYRLDEDQCAEGEQAFMLVVNASNIQKDWDWIEKANTGDCSLINISDQTSLLAVQGPKATDLLSRLTDYPVGDLGYYHFTKTEVAGIANVLVSATGYTGAGGYELYLENKNTQKLWDAIFALHADTGVQPIGLGARDTLRLEMGYCLYGNDINDETSPIEAGLSWITKTKKKEDFPSKDIFASQRKEGVSKKLVAFRCDDRRVPRASYKITNEGGDEIGYVTSGTLSPTLEKPIGMGYVNKASSQIGTDIWVETGRKRLKSTIVKAPFVEK